MALNIIVILGISLIFPGIISLTKAKIAGRKGPSILAAIISIIYAYSRKEMFTAQAQAGFLRLRR